MAVNLESLFRLEASELTAALTKGLLALEKDAGSADLIAQCFRLAHTLKGAARTVRRTDVSELAHTMEEVLAPYRESGEPVEPDCVSDLLAILNVIRTSLEHPAPANPGNSPGTEQRPAIGHAGLDLVDDRLETIRVERSDMDAVLWALTSAKTQLRGLGAVQERLAQAQQGTAELLAWREQAAKEASTRKDPVQRQRMLAELESLRTTLMHLQRDLSAAVEGTEQELGEAYRLVSRLRLVPVSVLQVPLELSARDAAQQLGKQVELEFHGGDIRIEANIMTGVRDALLHMVRNAVDHGIEPAVKRQQLGKAAMGRVSISAVQRGHKVAFLCKDDGGGIDPAQVLKAAVARRVVDAAAAAELGEEELLQLIFRAGVSTSPTVTEMSGRGVGLDIVRETAHRYNGEARVVSQLGIGSTIELSVPTSLSSLAALVLSLSDMLLLLPLDAVRGALRISDREVISLPDGDSILFEGRTIPFLSLGAAFGKGPLPSARFSVAVAQAGSELVALGAERLEGTLEVVVKPLPATAGTHPLILGAAFGVQGLPLLVLDPRGVLMLRRQDPLPRSKKEAAARSQHLPILVVDDSLTTRTLEQSILEAAGYTVDLASSGEDGLTMARAKSYGLFIVDIEMPGMNGLQFTTLTRADAALLRVPVILVSSLSSAEDRLRGISAGAAAYFIKSEFDQGLFLKRVAELLR